VWRISHPLLGEDVGQMDPQCYKNHRTAWIHSTDITEDGRKEFRIFKQIPGPPGHIPHRVLDKHMSTIKSPIGHSQTAIGLGKTVQQKLRILEGLWTMGTESLLLCEGGGDPKVSTVV
jgi:hypothetical protein